MRHAQIERLRTLKKRINQAWESYDGVMEAGLVLVNVEQLVDILLMERDGHDGGRVLLPVKGKD